MARKYDLDLIMEEIREDEEVDNDPRQPKASQEDIRKLIDQVKARKKESEHDQ